MEMVYPCTRRSLVTHNGQVLISARASHAYTNGRWLNIHYNFTENMSVITLRVLSSIPQIKKKTRTTMTILQYLPRVCSLSLSVFLYFLLSSSFPRTHLFSVFSLSNQS
ncbi:hypothetical protein NC653_033461 [Populus alba x Populus x berolinensis]|uniref:Uncharacterized protein n=1 Tax=Populus alba x Populus x berolinensis TaxID=444605 RepID=A0AAD6Q0X4_9ROSI|nr:hypothetical protein NC653_033461 [Populus alba x Populus x berolinensis]